MAILLKIGGVDRTGLLAVGSLRIPDRINQRSEASFDLNAIKANSGYLPHSLDSVEIWNGGTVPEFEGFLWIPKQNRFVEDATRPERLIAVQAVDLHLLADRQTVAETYDNLTYGAIVRNLLAKYLAADGVTAGNIQDGPLAPRIVQPYIPLSQAMDELCAAAGFFWRIRPGRKLDFCDRATNVAPWVVNSSAPVRDVSVEETPEFYRNQQIVRAGMGETDPQTEAFRGDGARRTFTVGYPIGKAPTITVNGGAKTVGIRGVDPAGAFAYYWNKSSQEVTQDNSEAVLRGPDVVGGPDVLSVVYVGLFPITVIAEKPLEIAARKAAEGYTGIHSAVAENKQIETEDAAIAAATAMLERWGRLLRNVTFSTDQTGLKAGQLVPINLPDFGLNGTFLITEVMTQEVETEDYLRYHVQATDGDGIGGSWVDFFKKLAQQGRTFSIRENEVLVRLKSFGDGLIIGDTFTLTRAAPESRVGFAQVGFAEVK